jgi:transketolase
MPNSAKHDAMANAIRFLAMDAVQAANSGHPGLPMGAADIATVLWTKFLKHDPANPDWPDRDRFILSAGHGSMLLYSLLHLTGYEDFPIEQLKNFRQLGYRTAGHPEYGHGAGIETTTGPLGAGLGNAVGFALAERHLNAHFGNALVDHYTYVIAGDGCLMEGISQEAISLAGHLKLSKLIVLWDDNNITIDGAVSVADSTNQRARFEACNWETMAVDGHDAAALEKAIAAARKSDKPTLIACKTTIGFGAPTKAGTKDTHGSPLGPQEIAGAREKLNWLHAPFEIPADIRDNWRVSALHSAKARIDWLDRLAEAEIDQRAEFERRMSGELPAHFEATMQGWYEKLVADKPNWATRKSSEEALKVITKAVPETIGGSADLTGSNNTKTPDTLPIKPGDYAGRYVHWGIREHGMGAGLNGLALHGGIIPYGGTFLCFSDYARPAMRLASLMGIRSIFVMTHDSIGLGEDGPTHQPVEHLAALRAIPNHLVMRPADAYETAECWHVALTRRNAPSTLVLTRQNLPAQRHSVSRDNLCGRGAYELSGPGGDTEITFFASGSEVEIAMAAKTLVEKAGHTARVVSVPCFELFEEQPAAYKRSVLGASPVNVAIEAAIRQGWDRFIGREGIFIGMTGFGASAPAPQLYEHFGITPAAAAKAALDALTLSD